MELSKAKFCPMTRQLNLVRSRRRISWSSWCPRCALNLHAHPVSIDRFHFQPKATPAASTSTSTSTPTPVSAPTPPKPVEPTPAASVPAATSETQDPAPSAPSDPAPAAAPTDAPPEAPAPAPALGSSFLSGEALQATIRNIEEMGFPRDHVLRALRASYNNPDRAVEYLFNVRINIVSAIQCLT